MSCWRELGVEPAPETENLRAQLLQLVPAESAGGQGLPWRERDDLPERALVIAAAARERVRRRAELAGRPAIAVLSFTAIDGELDRHLGDGIAGDIATELGRFRELDVLAPTAAFAYRDAAVAPERAGAELGATYVLEGRVRPFGERLRLTVRLVETAGARQLWAERYDCPRAAIFALQDDVVRASSAASSAASRTRGSRPLIGGTNRTWKRTISGCAAGAPCGARTSRRSVRRAGSFSRRWSGTRALRAPTSGSRLRT